MAKKPVPSIPIVRPQFIEGHSAYRTNCLRCLCASARQIQQLPINAESLRHCLDEVFTASSNSSPLSAQLFMHFTAAAHRLTFQLIMVNLFVHT